LSPGLTMRSGNILRPGGAAIPGGNTRRQRRPAPPCVSICAVNSPSLHSILLTVSAATHVRRDKITEKKLGREWNADRTFARHIFVALAMTRTRHSYERICRHINKNGRYWREVNARMKRDQDFCEFVASFQIDQHKWGNE
jgi:hypothetical protein